MKLKLGSKWDDKHSLVYGEFTVTLTDYNPTTDCVYIIYDEDGSDEWVERENFLEEFYELV